MRINIDVLSQPIHLLEDKITVLCIENKNYYRQVVKALYEECPEEQNIIFSKNYEPFKFKNNVKFITNYYNIDFTSSFYKKLYEQLSIFCVSEIPELTIEMKQNILKFIDIVIENYDFDFQSNDDVLLPELFKILNVKPYFNKEDVIENLLEYILIMQKYAPVKLFILLNLHNDFSDDEITQLYNEFLSRNIPVFVLESNTNFKKSPLESVTIIDEDLCEIVEK